MATSSVLRFRRSAAQLHALAEVERTIRAADSKSRRKYLRDFTEAFRTYRSVLKSTGIDAFLRGADILLVGDYHALPASQRFAGRLVKAIPELCGRPVVLGLEALVARDQHIVDEWFRGDIETQELRERIRFDSDWGYDWQPYAELLEPAREHAAAIYGLDCLPRSDMRSIGARDRHAAARIADIRARHPQAVLVVLFGESHLAPNHLPQLLKARRPTDAVRTILQNIDPLYWKAAGEDEPAEAVQIAEHTACVFTSTPLEKYENYRLCIERWRMERAAAPDLAPTFYNLIDALLRFLHIDRYAAVGERSIVDLLPEVCCQASGEQLERALTRRRGGPRERWQVLNRVAERGSCYLPRLNTIFARDFRVPEAAEEITRFVHWACRRGDVAQVESGSPQDRLYARAIEAALSFVGSKVLCPNRRAVCESDLRAYCGQSRQPIERLGICSHREFREMIDFLLLHKDVERSAGCGKRRAELLRAAARLEDERLDFAAEKLGHMLGSEIYQAYLCGRVRRHYLRSLFFRSLAESGAAPAMYFSIVRRLSPPTRRARKRQRVAAAVSDQAVRVLP